MKLKLILKKFRKGKASYVGFVVILIVFPLALRTIYCEQLAEKVAIEFGDLLAYYGTALGIFLSFVTYRMEERKKKKERDAKLEPFLSVELSKENDNSKVFLLRITDHTERVLTSFYIYDEFLAETLSSGGDFRLSYNQSGEDAKKLNVAHNITVDSNIVDKDGFPKYIQICCDDIYNDMWNCIYSKTNDCGRIHYYLRSREIV